MTAVVTIVIDMQFVKRKRSRLFYKLFSEILRTIVQIARPAALFFL